MAERPSARVVEVGCIPSLPLESGRRVFSVRRLGRPRRQITLAFNADRSPRPVPFRNRCANRSGQAHSGCCGPLSTRCDFAFARLSPAPRMTLTRTASEAVIVAERTGLFWPIRPRACWPARGLFLVEIYGWQQAYTGATRNDLSEPPRHPDFAIFSPGESETGRG
jgi:hypothetical protein